MINKKENEWEKSQKRLEYLWNNEILDRCCISVTAPKSGASCPELVGSSLEEKWLDGECIYQNEVARMKSLAYYGDAFPCIFLNFGAAGNAAYYGSKPVLRPDTIWFDPCIEDAEEYEKLEMSDPFGMYPKQVEIAEYLAEKRKGEFIVSMPDNCVAIDVLSHLRGPENLLCDMLTDPDLVHVACRKLIEGWKKTTMGFHQAIRKHQNGSCIGWLSTFAPGLHAQVQCDIGAMISREMYEEFFLEELTQACQFLDQSLYHLDGIEQKRFLDLILSVKELKMIQWTSVNGQPPALESLESLRAIQEAGKGLLLNLPAIYVEDALKSLSSKGLYLVTTAPDEESAKHLVSLAEKYTHE